ncbi:TfoX/Sxy family protein [Longimicrobium terrae]|uniref:DNA transformation protein n=1 Tax=Longimicrobium terrae TaxID=1639882 RepID=A0A841H5G3_9BACT|nr:TfoX/Sxy family protein [Longimicrobium terrae]MBB4638887.1 DNA transformation protein [Longimicrobium terrae]MBB6073126.1 DNA transformation protein [Longimicrobium terrae]NNC30187.1 TfoX/Sxy family protein [Longimicrobium terrae]
MAVSPDFREFVLEQMGRVAPVSGKSMFGGVGVRSEGVFFALISGGSVFLKVDDTNRPDYEAAGMGPFDPWGDGRMLMSYHELPAELLEDPDALRPWMQKALDVARRTRKPARRSRAGGRGRPAPE